jgi:hypothetical protein
MFFTPAIQKGACCALLWAQLWPLTAAAQQQPTDTPAPAGTTTQTAVSRNTGLLRILILEGENVFHNPRLGYTAPLVIEVRDQNGFPIEGADVTFELPATGPGGYFPGQQLSYSTKTNYQGQAEAAGFQPKAENGRFQVRITVSYGSAKQTIVANQSVSDSMEPGVVRRSSRKWLWIGLIGAVAAGVGVYLGTRGDNSSSSTPSVVLTPGPVTIGAPR